MPTPAGSDETAVDEDVEAAKVAEPNMAEDVREQRELIAKLKAERAAAKAQAAAEPSPSQEVAEEMLEDEGEASGTKRTREEEPKELRFNFKEKTEGEVGERTIATNRRVGLLGRMPPERKSLAWGALAFAAGMGAM